MGQFGLISHRRYVDNEQPWTNVYFSDEQKHTAECRRAYIRERKEEKMLAILQQYYDRIKQEGIEAVNDDLSIDFEAQQSLKKLTNESFQTTRAWQSWLDENGDPFAVIRVSG